MVNPDFETEGTQPEYVKDLYAVYPVHIRRFLSRFGVTTLEMTEMLGLPSVQEWYRIKKTTTSVCAIPSCVVSCARTQSTLNGF